jgi:hypothetical protein
MNHQGWTRSATVLAELLDGASRQSFPASDAPTITLDDGRLCRRQPIADALGPVASPVWRRRSTGGPTDRIRRGHEEG